MNRLDMARCIAKHVPILIQRDGMEWKHLEKLRRQFVDDYTLARIPRLTMDEYVIGKGKNNPSFCYRVERVGAHQETRFFERAPTQKGGRLAPRRCRNGLYSSVHALCRPQMTHLVKLLERSLGVICAKREP